MVKKNVRVLIGNHTTTGLYVVSARFSELSGEDVAQTPRLQFLKFSQFAGEGASATEFNRVFKTGFPSFA